MYLPISYPLLRGYYKIDIMKPIRYLFLTLLVSLLSCSKSMEKQLEGQFKLHTVLDTLGNITVVDTLFFNFQNTIFRCQWFDSKGKVISQPDGFYALADRSLELRLVYPYQTRDSLKIVSRNPIRYQVPIFPLFLDHDTLRKVRFELVELSSKSLVLREKAITYMFERY